MQSTDFDLIKDIPGYKVILKTVLKKQIQQLVEQLADHTGEESVLLTASVSDGSLSHLGSESGKVFLQDHDEIKSQFLGFCLKRHHTQKQNETRQQQQSQSNVEPYLTLTSMGPEKRQRFPPLYAPPTPSLHIPMQFRNSSQFSSSPADIHPVALTRAQPQSTSKVGHSNARHEPYSKKRPRKKQERPRPAHQDSGTMKLPTEPSTVSDNDASEVLVKVEASDDQSDLSGVHSSDKSENSNDTGAKTTNKNHKSSSSQLSLATSQVSLTKDNKTNSSSSNVMNEAAGDDKTSGDGLSVDAGLVSLGDNMDETGDSGSVSQGEISEVDAAASVKLECITESDHELEITGVEPGLMTIPDNKWASGVPSGIGYDQGQGEGQSDPGLSRRASTGGTQESDKISRQIPVKARRVQYSDDSMALAIKMVRNSKMTQRQASLAYGVPRTTLHDKLTGKSPEDCSKPGPSPVLTAAEEVQLVNHFKLLLEIGQPQSGKEIRYEVKKMLDAAGRKTLFKDNLPSKDWYRAFVSRHPELIERTSRSDLSKEDSDKFS